MKKDIVERFIERKKQDYRERMENIGIATERLCSLRDELIDLENRLKHLQ